MAWTKAKQNAYMRDYYVRNRERVLAANRDWRARNKVRHLSKAKEYHWANREEILIKKRAYASRPEIKTHRAHMLRLAKYGLTAEQYEGIFQRQKGLCAICSSSDPLVVDHCHDSGEVRALLCNACNQVLGIIREDVTRLEQMKRYLTRAAMVKAQAVVQKAGAPPPPTGAGQPEQTAPQGQ